MHLTNDAGVCEVLACSGAECVGWAGYVPGVSRELKCKRPGGVRYTGSRRKHSLCSKCVCCSREPRSEGEQSFPEKVQTTVRVCCENYGSSRERIGDSEALIPLEEKIRASYEHL